MNKGFLSPRFDKTEPCEKVKRNTDRWSMIKSNFNEMKVKPSPIKWIDDRIKLPLWVQIYFPGLTVMDHSTVYYISLIETSKSKYPEKVVSALTDYIDTGVLVPDLIPPRNLINTGFSADYILGSVVHFRKYNLENTSLALNTLEFKTLFLVTSNIYERTPIRNLLSRFTDQELYTKFGTVKSYRIGDIFQNKRQMLDTFVGGVLSQWDYISIDLWEYPGFLIINKIEDLTIGELSQDRYSLENFHQVYEDLHDMTKLRLLITFLSHGTFYNLDIWKPLIKRIYSEYSELLETYKNETNTTSRDLHQTNEFKFPSLYGFEDVIDTCLLCRVSRPLSQMSECGHATCLKCHIAMGGISCPFCNEHFTCIDITFDSLKEILGNYESHFWNEKIKLIKEEKDRREVKLDFNNGGFVLPI